VPAEADLGGKTAARSAGTQGRCSATRVQAGQLLGLPLEPPKPVRRRPRLPRRHLAPRANRRKRLAARRRHSPRKLRGVAGDRLSHEDPVRRQHGRSRQPDVAVLSCRCRTSRASTSGTARRTAFGVFRPGQTRPTRRAGRGIARRVRAPDRGRGERGDRRRMSSRKTATRSSGCRCTSRSKIRGRSRWPTTAAWRRGTVVAQNGAAGAQPGAQGATKRKGRGAFARTLTVGRRSRRACLRIGPWAEAEPRPRAYHATEGSLGQKMIRPRNEAQLRATGRSPSGGSNDSG